MQSIPVVGTYLSFFLFGGAFPGTAIIPRLYIDPRAAAAGHHPGAVHRPPDHHVAPEAHPVPRPGQDRGERRRHAVLRRSSCQGRRLLLHRLRRHCAVLAAFAQINPVWLYGPYDPRPISAGSQPDWYMGFPEGALRMMPGWEINFLGHTLTLDVFIPFAVPLGIIFTVAALYPFIEAWVTGDKREHHILTARATPRSAPALGVAAIALLRHPVGRGRQRPVRRQLHFPLYTITWFVRVASSWCRSSRTSSPNGSASACSATTPSCSPRRGDRHHPAAAPRRVHRGGPAAHRGGARRRRVQAIPPALPGPGKPDITAIPAPPRAARWAGPAASPTARSPRP